jgi:hypothetical protein
MAKAKKVKISTKDGPAEAEEIVLPEVTGEAKPEAPKETIVSSSGPHADVYSSSGEFVRSYKRDVHGKGFIELANEFAKKIGGAVR